MFRLKDETGKKMKIDTGSKQILGTREQQDDAYAISNKKDGVLAIVADGIGGYANGYIASQIAVKQYVNTFQEFEIDNYSIYFQKVALAANQHILSQFAGRQGGTTAVAAIIKDYYLHWSSIGDSNISLFRQGRLFELNRKENVKNWMEEQYRVGNINTQMLEQNQTDKRLINYLGYHKFLRACENDRLIQLYKGDIILLYSDGVELLDKMELEEILTVNTSAQKLADRVMKAIQTKKQDKKDNATIVILSLK